MPDHISKVETVLAVRFKGNTYAAVNKGITIPLLKYMFIFFHFRCCCQPWRQYGTLAWFIFVGPGNLHSVAAQKMYQCHEDQKEQTIGSMKIPTLLTQLLISQFLNSLNVCSVTLFSSLIIPCNALLKHEIIIFKWRNIEKYSIMAHKTIFFMSQVQKFVLKKHY